MYAIVKTGGRQYRVAVGDQLDIGNLVAQPGESVTLPAVLVVDGATVTTDAATLADTAVTATVDSHGRGPKIKIHKFKNKTRYNKRQGHRQALTTVTVTGIGAEQAGPSETAAPAADESGK